MTLLRVLRVLRVCVYAREALVGILTSSQGDRQKRSRKFFSTLSRLSTLSIVRFQWLMEFPTLSNPAQGHEQP
jgi:hypothetical protein